MASRHLSSPEISPTPKLAKRSVRHQLELSFPSEELRDAFLACMESAKQRLFPGKSVDNAQLFFSRTCRSKKKLNTKKKNKNKVLLKKRGGESSSDQHVVK